jgi:hypothetical protein
VRRLTYIRIRMCQVDCDELDIIIPTSRRFFPMLADLFCSRDRIPFCHTRLSLGNTADALLRISPTEFPRTNITSAIYHQWSFCIVIAHNVLGTSSELFISRPNDGGLRAYSRGSKRCLMHHEQCTRQ